MIPIIQKFKQNYKGYSDRINPVHDLGIVVHTTNGQIGTSYESEVNYLYNSSDVSAHFIIGKNGTITQLVDLSLCAWHAGLVNDRRFNNNNSIGIELHFTPGESKYQPALDQALTELVQMLINSRAIYGVKMHRSVAIFRNGRLGRKEDPSHMSDEDFNNWRDSLFSHIYMKNIKSGAPLYTAPDTKSMQATHITNDQFQNGYCRSNISVPVQYISNGWVWIPDGTGFIETSWLL